MMTNETESGKAGQPEVINSDTTKICPLCAKEIDAKANICPFCGKYLTAIEKHNAEENGESIPQKQQKSNAGIWVIIAIIVIIGLVCIFAFNSCSGGSSSSNGPSRNTSWSCLEYDPPYDVVFIDGEADVYGGVDEPSSSVKGNVTGGAGGIEARCTGSTGSFYRLRGVDWWGWVKISDTYK